MNAFLILIVALYASSLFLPGFVTNSGDMPGFNLLLMGIFAVQWGIVAWFANPLAGGALMAAFFKNYKLGLVLAVLAVAVGLDSFRAVGIEMYADAYTKFLSVASGFYVWEASLVALVVLNAVGFLFLKKTSS